MAPDPYVAEDPTPQRTGGFLGFLATIPGILTAIASLITAVSGAWLLFGTGSEGTPTPPEPAPQQQDLDVLAASCAGGYLADCDALYWTSPVGSDYEHFGATCGGIFVDWGYVGRCAGL